MIGKLIRRIFGTRHEREMRRVRPLVVAIRELEPKISALSDEQLAAKTAEFKQKLQNGATLDDLLIEAFAVVREVSRRVLRMRHFDVQMLGAIILHEGKIAEMKTGEGKTLVATAPLYLNALTGRGVHLVTVNDYLASRDADWMGKIYNFLGMRVGKVLTTGSAAEHKSAYAADITYGTNNEFGFDYLRDNMKYSLDEYVQREHFYAIVDEVDSILIDEARTPLIISGQVEQNIELYYEINKIIPFLKKDEDYVVDEKHHSATLTDEGIDKVEKFLKIDNLYHPKHIEYLHHVNKALQAHTLYKRDVNYIIVDNKVVIVDEFTGRPMPGRRWSDGLHQAVEAKEGVPIQHESETLATVTFQNYFRMYEKLAGMTGTADTEAEEFKKIYELDVVVIPTNKPVIRIDHPDVIYRTEGEKIAAVIDQIEASHAKGQPLLVGTVSVEKSEVISHVLKRKGIPHSVLNAKQHRKEASIVAQAGRKGAVTIATNMAGRGTDIVLGGNPEGLTKDEMEQRRQHGELNELSAEEIQALESKLLAKYRKQCQEEREAVLKAGGLFIIGTERHESRRIDNQLRGRSGRQGDPGESRFYLSLEDDLMRIFGADRLGNLMDRLGMEPGVPIEHSMVTKAIENAQKRVEGRNFDIRKNLLEYDDVMDQQRKSIYGLRRRILEGHKLRDLMLDAYEDVVISIGDRHCPEGVLVDDWNLEDFAIELSETFNIQYQLPAQIGNRRRFLEHAWEQVERAYEAQEAQFNPVAESYNQYFALDGMKKKSGGDLLRELEQRIYLTEIDQEWRAHLSEMNALRDAVGLRGYGQKDPKQEYKKAGYDLFVNMLLAIKTHLAHQVFRIQVAPEESPIDLGLAEALKSPVSAGLQLEIHPQEPHTAPKAEDPPKARQVQTPKARATDAQLTENPKVVLVNKKSDKKKGRKRAKGRKKKRR